MNRIRQRAGSRGTSTIEMLAAASISLIVLAVASSFFTSQQRMLLVQSAYAQSQNVTRTFTDLFGRELRMASYDPSGAAIAVGPTGLGVTCPSIKQGLTLAGPTTIRFKQDLNGDGDTSDPNEDVEYQLSGSQIQRTDFNSNGGAAVTLVDGVSNGGFTITYFDNSNPPVQKIPTGTPPLLSASDRDCVAKVRVQLTAQLASPQFYDIQPLISSVDAEYAIRSRSNF